MKYERFHNDRLTLWQNKAVEMLYNGMDRDAIAEEMDISPRALRSLFARARDRGEPVPRGPTGDPAARFKSDAIPITKLIRARAYLREAGRKRGMNKEIAARIGLTENNVKVRLWKHDHRQGARAA